MHELRIHDARYDASATRLPALLARSFHHLERGNSELEVAVRAFVEGERRERTPPERVVVALKQAAWEAAASTRATQRESNEMTDRLVRWFVDSYYAEEHDAPRSASSSFAHALISSPPSSDL